MAEQAVRSEPRKKRDWVTPVAVIGGAGAVGFGLWFFMRKTTAGAITDKWVNKGSFSHQPMPFKCGADGQTFEVGVSYKNTGKEATVIGAEVIVTKPNGEVVQPTVDMAGADVGEVLSKEYNIAAVNQIGQWAIVINIITEKGDVLETFEGICLDVVEEVEPGEWGQAGVILAKVDFETEVGEGVPGDWFPAGVELDRVEFTVPVAGGEPGDWFPANAVLATVEFDTLIEAGVPQDWFPANTEMARKNFSVSITGGGGPGPAPPEIETEKAENVTDNSATLTAELIDEGFCSGAYCYIEWGKTTSYGSKSRVVRLQPGRSIVVDAEGLDPDTKYYFRAVAEGRCQSPYLIGYSQGRSFTTEEEAVTGFDLEVVGAPSAAGYWNCHIEWESGEEAHSGYLPIGSPWHYEGAVPSSRVDMCINCFEGQGGAYLKHACWEFVFRLYAGRDYQYDFSDYLEHWWEE